ncbi:division/cell wall cluster transcriptional repressor MraZ [Rhodovulum sp. DZ06]|uniref:division/cell wall cluster transcriptional repressor MraZ n=1 Tax=Rhodovulum sp. DZ06 TaxID=3425126 RepID=UPI003D34B17C
MQEGFHGAWVHKVDSKGRVSVPADFRRELEAEGVPMALRLVPNMDKEPCIDGYSLPYLKKIRKKIRRLQPGSAARKNLEHLFGARMEVLPVDPAGRVVLPAHLREAYAASGQVAFVGADQTFQIWAADDWAAECARRDEAALDDGNPLLGLDWDDDEEDEL